MGVFQTQNSSKMGQLHGVKRQIFTENVIGCAGLEKYSVYFTRSVRATFSISNYSVRNKMMLRFNAVYPPINENPNDVLNL